MSTCLSLLVCFHNHLIVTLLQSVIRGTQENLCSTNNLDIPYSVISLGKSLGQKPFNGKYLLGFRNIRVNYFMNLNENLNDYRKPSSFVVTRINFK